MQLQYLYVDPDDGISRDRIFFRRLHPYIQGSVTRNWDGKIQVDFGDAEEVAIKDAYMRYKGWKNLELYIGNTKSPVRARAPCLVQAPAARGAHLCWRSQLRLSRPSAGLPPGRPHRQ